MVGEPLHVLGEAVGVELLMRGHQGGVQRAAAVAEQAAVGHFMAQGMLESVFEVGEDLRFVQKLRPLQAIEPGAQRLFRLVRDGLK